MATQNPSVLWSIAQILGVDAKRRACSNIDAVYMGQLDTENSFDIELDETNNVTKISIKPHPYVADFAEYTLGTDFLSLTSDGGTSPKYTVDLPFSTVWQESGINHNDIELSLKANSVYWFTLQLEAKIDAANVSDEVAVCWVSIGELKYIEFKVPDLVNTVRKDLTFLVLTEAGTETSPTRKITFGSNNQFIKVRGAVLDIVRVGNRS